MSELPKPTGSRSRQNVTIPSADTTAHGHLAPESAAKAWESTVPFLREWVR